MEQFGYILGTENEGLRKIYLSETRGSDKNKRGPKMTELMFNVPNKTDNLLQRLIKGGQPMNTEQMLLPPGIEREYAETDLQTLQAEADVAELLLHACNCCPRGPRVAGGDDDMLLPRGVELRRDHVKTSI